MAEEKMMTKTERPLGARLYVKAHEISELEKILKEEQPIDTMLWCIMYVLFFHSMLFMLLSSFSPNSKLNICKIWQIPYVRLYMSILVAAIVSMLLYALCRVIAQAVRMWKEKDNPGSHQWEEDLYLSAKPVDL